MARMSRLDSIENQIKKKQEKLFELKEKSDAVAEEIQALIQEKEAICRESILTELDNSGRTYEEVLEFLKSAPKRNVSEPKAKRKYKPRKAK